MTPEQLKEMQKTLAEMIGKLLRKYGDTPEVRLAIANYTFGYLGVSCGLTAT